MITRAPLSAADLSEIWTAALRGRSECFRSLALGWLSHHVRVDSEQSSSDAKNLCDTGPNVQYFEHASAPADSRALADRGRHLAPHGRRRSSAGRFWRERSPRPKSHTDRITTACPSKSGERHGTSYARRSA
jgi:hypothetical protein